MKKLTELKQVDIINEYRSVQEKIKEKQSEINTLQKELNSLQSVVKNDIAYRDRMMQILDHENTSLIAEIDFYYLGPREEEGGRFYKKEIVNLDTLSAKQKEELIRYGETAYVGGISPGSRGGKRLVMKRVLENDSSTEESNENDEHNKTS